MENVKVGIKNMDFSSMRGKIVATLTDGRIIIVPVSFFPDIKNLSVKKREEWMVLDDQYFTFEHLTRIYSIVDLMRLS
ncbi:MAG: hypothetical protein IK004_05225 [Bacteroidales bacterium]|nr:hypothetical protein [Bacteroidales bacterium]